MADKDKGQAGRKYSEIEIQERITFILDCRRKGEKTTSGLFRFFSEKYPNLTKRQFEYDLRVAKELIREHFETDIDFEISEIVGHYWDLYNKSLKMQDYRECRSILKEVSALKGLVVTKLELKQKTTTDLNDLSDDDLLRIINERNKG